MVPFYETVYKSSLYDLIIPFPACESGAEREKRRAVVFASEKTEKANNLIINSLWIVFYVEWHQLPPITNYFVVLIQHRFTPVRLSSFRGEQHGAGSRQYRVSQIHVCV